jgi:hypothetical protein
MSACTIGLAVASDELRAVAVRGGVVRWAVRAGRTEEPALSVQIAALLAQAPVPRWRRWRAIAVVGPSAAQVRRLTGLPPLESRATLSVLVREGAGRFFLRNGVPLEVAGVRVIARGSVWAAAFEQPMVAEIAAGCRAAGLTLRAIAPAVNALGAGLQDDRVVWRDGDVRAQIVFAKGTLTSVRRLPSELPAGAEQSLRPVAALGSLGKDAWRFADAYGAALASDSEPLALRTGAQSDAAVSRRRIVAASIAFASAALIALVTPAVASVIDQSRVLKQLNAIAPQARDAAVVEQELRRMTRALAQVDAFATARRSPTALLASLTRVLPPGAALVTLRVDSAGGTLVFLAPRAARAIASLDSVAEIASPEVVGPVTKEIAGTKEVERATVRFRLAVGAPR